MQDQDDTIRLTRKDYDKLVAELKHKEEVEIPALAIRLKEAIAMGDLKENAEYIDSKEAQAMLDGQIKRLKSDLERAIIIDKYKKVTVVEVGEIEEETYELVSPTEADPSNGRISTESPIGSALANAKKGQIVSVEAPVGTIQFKVVKIS